MSKRGGTELNHENWNEDDEPEEAGTFKKAGEGQLKGRVIKRARRRNAGGEEGEKKNVFSGFGGFAAKPAATEAFSFLSANKPTTEPPKTESSGGTGSSFVFGSAKSSSSTASTGFSFGSVTSGATSPAKPSFSFGNTDSSTKKDAAPVFGAFGSGNNVSKDTEAKTENKPVFGAFGTGNSDKKESDNKTVNTPVFGAFGAGSDSKKDSNSNSSSASLFGSKSAGSETVAPASSFGSFAFGEKKIEDPKPAETAKSGGDLMSSFKPPPGGGFKFGGSNSEVKPSSDSSSSSSAGFSFGATSAGKTDADSKAGAGFVFGTSSNQSTKPAAAVTGFAFGAKKETSSEKTTINDNKAEEKPSETATFSFGAKTSDDKSNNSGGGFSFGTSSKSTEKPAAVVSSFSFGSNGSSKDDKEKDKEIITPVTQETSEVDQEPNKEFLSHLKALNNQVLAWIKQHLEQNPLVLLTPVFKDYNKHLEEITSKYGDKPSDTNSRPSSSSFSAPKTDIKTVETSKSSTSEPAIGQAAFGVSSTKSSSTFTFGSTSDDKPASSTAAPFSFGQVATVKPAASVPMFGSSTTNSAALGSGNLFSFNSGASTTTAAPPATDQKGEEDEDTPPVVEIKQVTEDDAVYSKKCKLFYKKDGTYVEKGVGMLYLKEVEGGRHQLLVRADTNLGNVLLNILLSPQIPTTRVGKNNVMLVCVPNPPVDPKADAAAPCPMLIRVKNGEDADELKEKLDEFKEEK